MLVESATPSRIKARIEVENFIGGHSGVDIHEQRGNALKFLINIISEFNKKSSNELEVIELRGGRAHNIIPREAFVELNIEESDLSQLESITEQVSKSWKSFLPKKDHQFKVHTLLDREFQAREVLSSLECQKIVNFLDLFPHGVHSFDLATSGVVGTSNNLARVLIVGDQFYLQSSLRFFDREEIKKIENQITLLAKISDINFTSDSEYPSWKPKAENSVLETVKKCYKDLYKKEPIVTAIHAGLECGILRDKIGELDVVSFGPTITGAHSPDERVNIPSVEKFWELYKEVLAKI